MKTLLLLRHAKSDRKYAVGDHDRPLNDRGRRDAPAMGRLLAEQGLVPDLILSSTAIRARDTAAEVARSCGYEALVAHNAALYLAAPSVYISALRQLSEQVSRILVVGHNPGLEELVTLLTGREETLPTAALAHIELPIDAWQELSLEAHGALRNLWRPKEMAL